MPDTDIEKLAREVTAISEQEGLSLLDAVKLATAAPTLARAYLTLREGARNFVQLSGAADHWLKDSETCAELRRLVGYE